jgi:hypothetical protein
MSRKDCAMSLSSIVSKYAPLLGSVVSSINPLAGIAVNLIAQAFGANPKNTDDIIAKINADPEAEIKLKQIEYQHEEILQKTATEDRMSAREREEKVIQVTGKRDYVLDSIAFTVVFGYFFMCAMVTFTKLDSTDHDILYMLIGQLTGGFIMVLSYYFGASNKSQGQ